MENDEWDMGLPERSKELLEICTRIHGVGAVSCEILGVDYDGEHVMDVFLEVLDVVGQGPNKGLVDEAEVGEEVVPNDDTGLLLERFDDLLELLLNDS
jgi:hypothetical protein